MPETVELRISGKASGIKKGEEQVFKNMFGDFFKKWDYQFTGTIVNDPDPTGMSLYKVEEVEGYKQRIGKLEEWIATRAESNTANNELTKTLAAQLEQKETAYSKLMNSYKMLDKALLNEQRENEDKDLKISALETKLRLKSKFNPKHLIAGVIIGAVATILMFLLSSCSSVKIQNVEVRQKTNVSPKDKLITICAYTSGYSLANQFYYRKP